MRIFPGPKSSIRREPSVGVNHLKTSKILLYKSKLQMSHSNWLYIAKAVLSELSTIQSFLSFGKFGKRQLWMSFTSNYNEINILHLACADSFISDNY